jgi:hypothetical protein
MSRIGEYKPGVANLPIPNNEADRALLKKLLGNAGGLTAALALPAHDQNAHVPGLFPENPYADLSPAPTGDNLFDSDGKSPPQPPSVPVPIAHYAEVPPLSQEYRSWAQAFHNQPVDEAEVAKVRALLNGTPLPNARATQPVDEAEVAKVRALLRGKPSTNWG